MRRPMRRPLPAAFGAATCFAVTASLGVASLAACAKSDPESGGAAGKGGSTVTVEITDAGCKPSPDSVKAGSVTFKVTNKNSGKVTEAELKRANIIIGEKENLTPGLSGSFALKLKAGKYTMVCPNASQDSWDFTVTGDGGGGSLAPGVTAALDQATAGYQQYVVGEVAKLIPATRKFTDAVRAGDVAQAQKLYAPARYFYEEIEPVAESFGDLDPEIDARADDVPDDPGKWSGFHRLEKALWEDKSLAGMAPVADKLDADVVKLQGLVATTTYQPAQLANGATELLNEVATSKVTGEEDRYSHTDLSDFEGNVVGARKAYDLLKPALVQIDAGLAASIEPRFDDVLAALKPYQLGDGIYVDYSTVGEDKRRVLIQKVNALAEPLSQVAAKVAG
jgi:iron uptake system component EfeO